MTIRFFVARNTIALITVVCCCIYGQVHASFESQRLMKGMRQWNRDNTTTRGSVPSIFTNKSSRRNQNKNQMKKKKKGKKPLKMRSSGSNQVPVVEAITDGNSSNAEIVYDERDKCLSPE